MNKIECLDAAKQASLAAGKKLKASFFETQDLLANSGRDIKLAIDKEIEEEIKAEGIDPHVFTIKSDFKTKTVAKLEFPLSASYKTSRERFSEVK